MAQLTLRLVKGTALTYEEVDQNFTNLNEDISTRLLASRRGQANGVASLDEEGQVPASQSRVPSVAGKTGDVELEPSDVIGFEAAASDAAPVQTVSGKTGDVTLSVKDVEGIEKEMGLTLLLARSLARLGDQGQTLHSDFILDAHGVGTAMSLGVNRAKRFEDLYSMQRASPVWVWQPSGPNGEMLLTEVAADEPAREWDPATGEPIGLLVEGAATNYVRNSETLSGSDRWSLTEETDPRLGAVLRMESLTGSSFRRFGYVFSGTEGDMATRSIIAKAGTLTTLGIHSDVNGPGDAYYCTYDLINGTARKNHANSGEPGIKHLGDGWYLCWIIFTLNTSYRYRDFAFWGRNADNSPAEPGQHLYVGKFQAEVGTTPTSYIPTYGAPATRAETFVTRQMGAEFDPDNFTLSGEIRNVDWSTDSASAFLAGFNQSAQTLSLGLRTRGERDGTPVLVARQGGGFPLFEQELGTDLTPPQPVIRYALAYDAAAGTISGAVNGESVTMEYDQGTPNIVEQALLDLGLNQMIKMHRANVRVYPVALDEATLAAMTALPEEEEDEQ